MVKGTISIATFIGILIILQLVLSPFLPTSIKGRVKDLMAGAGLGMFIILSIYFTLLVLGEVNYNGIQFSLPAFLALLISVTLIA